MFRLAPFAAAALLTACSDPLPEANNASPVEVNGVEDVMPAEGDIVNQSAATENAQALDNATDGSAGPTEAPTEAAYLGRWLGVEGMYLNIAKKTGGGVTMEMQWDLDNKGTFDGSVTAEGLRFLRNGVPETAVMTDGDATGLKWLAGKKNCLTIKTGEGYCKS